MTRIIADANIFLRFLTNDVPNQAERVESRFKDAEKGKIKIIVLQVTVVEILFQLEHWYKLKKIEAIEKIIHLFSPEYFELGNKDAVFEALAIYKSKNIDFVDLLISTISKQLKIKILSFDKDFDKLAPNIRLSP